MVGGDPEVILAAVADFDGAGAALPADLYGNGHSAEAIVEIITQTQ